MTEQLQLLDDGSQPADEHLGPVQRAVVRVLRRVGTMTADEAGAIAHAHRGKHPVDARCGYCAPDGAPILASLVARGVAENAGQGQVRPARTRPVTPPVPEDDTDPFPKGF